MADIHKSVLISYSAEKMYDLVTDVATYPAFLPWCDHVDVLTHSETELEARVHIHFKGIKAFFHTRNTHRRPYHIEMAFVDGPFKKFHGSWQFKPLEGTACKIEFNLHYTFSNIFLEKIIGPVFTMIANTFVDSFVKRARQIYGTS
jgi:ribosome-associated toxin RatA of RatAB toxin-antitoxin module